MKALIATTAEMKVGMKAGQEKMKAAQGAMKQELKASMKATQQEMERKKADAFASCIGRTRACSGPISNSE